MTSPNALSSSSGSRLTVRGMLTQTWALVVDAYRDVNSKKLFWITLVLSVFVALSFAIVGINERGFTFFHKTLELPGFNTYLIPKDQFYKWFIWYLGVEWWLGVAATVLALVSTTPMIADFLGSGSVDLYLSRPLSRVRLFLTKYMMGLLFAALQVTAFCVAAFLVLGVRAGVWSPGLFLAVPLVVLMYSYLWSICTLIATLTRSAIAAILITILLWAGFFGVAWIEDKVWRMSASREVVARESGKRAESLRADIERLRTNTATTQPDTVDADRLMELERQQQAEQSRAAQPNPIRPWAQGLGLLNWPLPKTYETTALLHRWLRADLASDAQIANAENDESPFDFINAKDMPAITAEIRRQEDARSATWVIGTSLAFEAVVLSLACWVFARRDY